MTLSLRIPPDPIKNEHNSLTFVKLPKSFLDRKIRAFVVVNEMTKANLHQMPNVVVGATEILDLDLRRILYDYAHKKILFPVKFDEHCPLYTYLIMSKLLLEMACFPTEAVDQFYEERFEIDYESKKGMEHNAKPYNEIDYFDEKDRWKFLSNQLQQKQELIHRTSKQLHDKSADLKTKGSEILELRGSIKVLKLENYKLKQKLEIEEQIENSREMHPDIEKMSDSELKNKLLKLSEAYRTQRMKNEEFDEAIKRAVKDA